MYLKVNSAKKNMVATRSAFQFKQQPFATLTLNHSPFPKLGLMNAGKNKAIGTRKPHAMYMRAPTRMGTIGEKTDDMKLQQQGGSSI